MDLQRGESCDNVERVDIVLVQKTQDLELTPPTQEGPNLSMAKNVITLNEHYDSADSFRRRILSLPTRPRGISQSKFHSLNHSRSKSMSEELNREDIDAKDYIEEDGVRSVKVDVINDDPNEWWNSSDGYGITRLFEISCNIMQDEEGIDQDAVDEIIKQKTKNKLYEIFIQQCPGVPVRARATRSNQAHIITSSGKRSLSQEGATTGSKCQIQPQTGNSTRSAKRVRTRPASKVQPGQQLLPNLWKKNMKMNGKKV